MNTKLLNPQQIKISLEKVSEASDFINSRTSYMFSAQKIAMEAESAEVRDAYINTRNGDRQTVLNEIDGLIAQLEELKISIDFLWEPINHC